MKVWILAALLAAFVAGCRTETTTVGPSLHWSIVKSDVTGKCYDAAYFDPGSQFALFALGAEVPCP